MNTNLDHFTRRCLLAEQRAHEEEVRVVLGLIAVVLGLCLWAAAVVMYFTLTGELQ